MCKVTPKLTQREECIKEGRESRRRRFQRYLCLLLLKPRWCDLDRQKLGIVWTRWALNEALPRHRRQRSPLRKCLFDLGSMTQKGQAPSEGCEQPLGFVTPGPCGRSPRAGWWSSAVRQMGCWQIDPCSYSSCQSVREKTFQSILIFPLLVAKISPTWGCVQGDILTFLKRGCWGGAYQ